MTTSDPTSESASDPPAGESTASAVNEAGADTSAGAPPVEPVVDEGAVQTVTEAAVQTVAEVPAELPPEPAAPTCRHEYVRIYQRRLKGLERRLVATKAWLPVGFKMTDFNHLGEGSYCFCSKCRTRLYPKRTNAEKAQARIALAAEKALQAELLEAMADDTADDTIDAAEQTDIHVEELVLESVELEDLDERTVAIDDDSSSCSANPDE
jgi:hypothetical protein